MTELTFLRCKVVPEKLETLVSTKISIKKIFIARKRLTVLKQLVDETNLFNFYK